ncbi:MAG: DUF1549 domain-containing protein [Gemmataceae bacterium]
MVAKSGRPLHPGTAGGGGAEANAREAGRWLFRRVTLDLTGLPPTIEETDRYLADTRPDAYDRLVDRLLASPPTVSGGRRAGSTRPATLIRRDSPATPTAPSGRGALGDPGAPQPQPALETSSPSSSSATCCRTRRRISWSPPGFHRNTLTNTEGGTNPEEFRSAAVADRVVTTFQAWTATTMICAQCHTHKYDPFSQKEFYQIFAIFNGSQDANGGDDAPDGPGRPARPRIGARRRVRPAAEGAR